VFLACSPDGTRVLTLDPKKKAFRVWSWPAGQLQVTAPLTSPRRLLFTHCGDARFTPDGKQFAAVVYYADPGEQQVMRRVPDHPFVEAWDPAAGKLLTRTELGMRNTPALAPTPAGLYFWGKDDEVRDVVTGRVLTKLRVPEGRGMSLDWSRAALSPDGRTVAVAGGFSEQTVLLFETWTGRYRGALPEKGRSTVGISFLSDGRLVSLATTATVWDVGLQPVPARGQGPWAEDERAREWERLGDPDPEKAWPAMAKLAGAPAEAVALARAHVRAVPALSDEALSRILRNLDAEEFKDREAASRALDRLGALAVPKVKAWLEKGASPEVTRRLTLFLAEHDRPEPAPGELRALRAVQVLETVGTPEAGKLLAELAGGEPAARLTQEAAAAVRRARR
jgi:hypothetical protein